jgi:alpha-amylase/alpha-mannosidase (GH57 family)
MDRTVCIHGHFYQPPRENPWLEAIERQESAHPYHDWNQRVHAECYAPNTASRILDREGNIERIVNNYSRISFNFGPTLLSWMEAAAHETYRAVLDADRESRARFGGHGSAVAQCYNHIIMPLASRRDKETQIVWGLGDFRARFGRDPEGMWLPETAVDLETLDLLARHGIRYTILSPLQARRARRMGSAVWEDVSGGRIDPTHPYLQALPAGRAIAIFFYDGALAQAVAFERLLESGAAFADRLRGALRIPGDGPQLVHVATDGESYGHHHRFGEMALAFALAGVEAAEEVRLTNYGEFLALHPPVHEVEIREGTSWSCAHGVGRWKSDCGCHTGAHADWNQAWRGPLRDSLDFVSGRLARIFETAGSELFKDPWAARDAYIEIVLDRDPERVRDFLGRHGRGVRTEGSDVLRLKLLELARHAMLMFTSCGWFFDDLGGIETVQVLQYAGRALQLAGDFGGGELEGEFRARLEPARSNRPGRATGRQVYHEAVQPGKIDLLQVGAHYGITTLIEDLPPRSRIYAYEAERIEHAVHRHDRVRLGLGRALVRSRVTWETATVGYAALHLGEHRVSGGVKRLHTAEEFRTAAEAVLHAFRKQAPDEAARALRANFSDRHFDFGSLFEDEQRRFLDRVVAEHVAEADRAYLKLYRDNADLLAYLRGLDLSLPEDLKLAADRALVHQLRAAIMASELDDEAILSLLERAQSEGVTLDHDALAFALQERMEETARSVEADPHDLQALRELARAVALVGRLPFAVDLWRVQNAFYRVSKAGRPEFERRAAARDPEAVEWLGRLADLGAKLRMRLH